MKIWAWITLASACCLAVFQCSPSRIAGGTGEETTNGQVAGVIMGQNGVPAIHSRVLLVPQSYDPIADSTHSLLLFDTTNDSGRYVFRDIQNGIYTLSASSVDGKTNALINDVVVGNKGLLVATATLGLPGSIKIFLPDSTDTIGGYLFIAGTGISAELSGAMGFVFLDSVPSGIIPSLRYAVRFSAVAPAVLRDSARVLPGDTTVVSYPGWLSSKKLHLNTTASGAGVSGMVTNFPVLVRLTSNTFNFAQARSDGGDLRFARSDGSPLPYEIEQWDISAGQAAIWVRVDTVFGNDSTHFITMCWGNSTATSSSNGMAVFDTANGFQGVWHMAQSQSANALDATGNHFDGAASDSSPHPVAGEVGLCQKFDGTSNYIQMPGTASGKLNFPQNGTYSVGAWVYADTLDSTYSKIVEKNNCQYKLQKDGLNRWEFSEYESALGYDMTTTPASAGAWVYLVGVREGSSQYLYVNGLCVNNVITVLADSSARDTTTDVTVGRVATPNSAILNFFKGEIDEVRIQNRALSPDWIKLCYMNQKTVDALVVFP